MAIDQIQLIPLPAGAPSPWRLTFNGQSGDTPATYPKVNAAIGSGPHLIVFGLGGNHSGITFDKTNPIWVNPGGKPNPGASDAQVVGAVSNDGKQLFVLNANDKPGELHYVVNFVGHQPLDPIIDNGGHGFYLGTTGLLIGAAVLLTLGYFLRPLFRAMFGR